MRDHVFFVASDADCPPAVKDNYGDVVLAWCRVCGGAECELPSECPGVLMSQEQKDSICSGLLDFKESEWDDIKRPSQNGLKEK
jgi:hypothetical protein